MVQPENGDHPRVCGEHHGVVFRRSLVLGDHPRVCGEHPIDRTCMRRSPGSSPRMRGTPAAHVRPHHRPGIIPAYAGNTRCLVSLGATTRDHPRVCGEHIRVLARIVGREGSSPRMRGTLALLVSPCADRGDHPRVCGEHTMRNFPYLRDEGSSPRMRGTRVMELRSPLPPGIIPAYAGNTRR